MSMSKFTGAFGALATIASLAGRVQAHGFVTGIVADGTYSTGYLVNQYPYMNPAPDSVGWTEGATDLGFVSDYGSADVICHKNGSNAQLVAEVAAGSTINVQWGTDVWPESHKGPVTDYLAACDDCTTVDKTTLKFFKIDQAGLISGSDSSGTWASDQLIANNNSWDVTIPSNIAAGNYVLRHEILALHSAGSANGAQSYPQCLNLKVTGGGDVAPSGTLGTELYSAQDPGVLVNIYQSMSTYVIPGPAVPTELASGSSSGAAPVASSVAASTTAAAATATAVPSSSLSVTSSVSSAQQQAATTAAPVASSTAAAPSAIVSAISSLTAALPSSVLTAAAPTATATTGSGQTISTAGMSVSELLDLLKQVLTQLFTSAGSSQKRHARDLAN